MSGRSLTGSYSEQQLVNTTDPSGSEPRRTRFRRGEKNKLEIHQARFCLVVWSAAPPVRGTC